MRRRHTLGLLVAGFVSLWLAFDRDQVQPLPAETMDAFLQLPAASAAQTTTTNPAVPKTAEATPTHSRSQAATPTSANPAAPATLSEFVVELRGLHPDLPWTEPLVAEVRQEMIYQGRIVPNQKAKARVDNGRATFWLENPTHRGVVVSVTAEDRNYDTVGRQFVAGENHVAIDVLPVATLRGRVVDEQGKPLSARVCAFLSEGDARERHALATTDSSWSRQFELRVPPNTELLVLAIPVHTIFEVCGSGDNVPNLARLDHAPSVVKARGALGTPAAKLDLVLARPSVLRGIVRTPEGRPTPHRHVRLQADNATNLVFARDCIAQLLPDGRVVNGMQATTDASGAFELPAPSGPLEGVPLVVATDEDVRVVQPVVMRATSTNEFVIVELPLPTHLRAMANGAAKDVTAVQFEGREPEPLQHRSWAEIIANAPTRVRLMHEGLVSEWRELGPADGGQTIELELFEANQDLHELRLRFPEDSFVRAARVQWQAADGSRGEARGLPRPDGTIPIRLPKGSHRLTVHFDQDCHVVPSEHELALATKAAELDVPLTIGGRFFVCAVDKQCRHRAGKITVKNALGEDATGRFHRGHPEDAGNVGQLLPGAPNHLLTALPVGDYELLFEFDGVAPIRERVRITAGGDARVDVRLP